METIEGREELEMILGGWVYLRTQLKDRTLGLSFIICKVEDGDDSFGPSRMC